MKKIPYNQLRHRTITTRFFFSLAKWHTSYDDVHDTRKTLREKYKPTAYFFRRFESLVVSVRTWKFPRSLFRDVDWLIPALRGYFITFRSYRAQLVWQIVGHLKTLSMFNERFYFEIV